MPILLLALATFDGKPIKIKIGKVINEPPPATVFKNPEIKPTPTTIKRKKNQSFFQTIIKSAIYLNDLDSN